MRRQSATSIGTRGVLVVPIGEILFGVHIEEVAGLIEADRIAALPRQQGPLAGVLAFRGGMIPALDLSAFLDVDPGLAPSRYGIVLSRGTERFALLIPALPRLVPGRELVEAKLSLADTELSSMIGSAYVAGDERVHCLRYWAIFDSVMPPSPGGRAETAPAARGG